MTTDERTQDGVTFLKSGNCWIKIKNKDGTRYEGRKMFSYYECERCGRLVSNCGFGSAQHDRKCDPNQPIPSTFKPFKCSRCGKPLNVDEWNNGSGLCSGECYEKFEVACGIGEQK